MMLIASMCFFSLVFSTSIYDDSIPLPVLDERIIKAMTDPQKEKGDDLLNDAYNYYNILDDIEKLLKDKDPKGEERLDTLMKEGGPQFVNVTMAEDFMRFLYKWDQSELNELRATIDGVKIVYERMVNMLNDMRRKRSEKKRAEEENKSSNQTYGQ